MKLSLSSTTHGPIAVDAVIPPELLASLLPGAVSSMAEGSFGKLLFQEICPDPYNVIHSTHRAKENFSLQSRGDQPALKIHVILKKDRTYHMQGIGDVLLREGQFNIIYVPYVEEDTLFEQGADYCSFSSYFPVAFMDEYLPFFPLIAPFLQQMTDEQPALLLLRHGWVTTEISKIIQNLLNCTLKDSFRTVYFEGKRKELLIKLLWQCYEPRIELSGLSAQHISSVQHAQYIIETHTGKELTVASIAKRADVNVYKLKTIFRQFTGVNISAFMLTTRLTNARIMLRETELPVKEVARLAGYGSKQSFITAFKNHFDYTPGTFRADEAVPYMPS